MTAASGEVDSAERPSADGGAIRGVVTVGWTPFSGAEITLTSESQGRDQATTYSGRDGRFAFAGLTPGEYALTVSAPGLLGLQWTGLLVSRHEQRWLDIDAQAVSAVPGPDTPGATGDFRPLPSRTLESVLRTHGGWTGDRGPLGATNGAGFPGTAVLVNGFEATDPLDGRFAIRPPFDLIPEGGVRLPRARIGSASIPGQLVAIDLRRPTRRVSAGASATWLRRPNGPSPVASDPGESSVNGQAHGPLIPGRLTFLAGVEAHQQVARDTVGAAASLSLRLGRDTLEALGILNAEEATDSMFAGLAGLLWSATVGDGILLQTRVSHRTVRQREHGNWRDDRSAVTASASLSMISEHGWGGRHDMAITGEASLLTNSLDIAETSMVSPDQNEVPYRRLELCIRNPPAMDCLPVAAFAARLAGRRAMVHVEDRIQLAALPALETTLALALVHGSFEDPGGAMSSPVTGLTPLVGFSWNVTRDGRTTLDADAMGHLDAGSFGSARLRSPLLAWQECRWDPSLQAWTRCRLAAGALPSNLWPACDTPGGFACDPGGEGRRSWELTMGGERATPGKWRVRVDVIGRWYSASGPGARTSPRYRAVAVTGRRIWHPFSVSGMYRRQDTEGAPHELLLACSLRPTNGLSLVTTLDHGSNAAWSGLFAASAPPDARSDAEERSSIWIPGAQVRMDLRPLWEIGGEVWLDFLTTLGVQAGTPTVAPRAPSIAIRAGARVQY